eukprot:COSAG01_NODE_6332_length_3731_cov_7.563051_1_plen_1055_part_00
MNSAMEPEPEDEEHLQAAAAAAAEAQDESAVLAARVQIAGHEVAANTTAIDASEWGLTAAQVREVAGALPQLLCLRELVLDGLPVSGSTPMYGDFQYGTETVDAGLDTFRALCAALRTCQALTSLSLGGCYLGPEALAVLAEVVFRDASAVALAHLAICQNKIGPEGGTVLVKAIKTSNLESVSIGKDLTLPIKGELDSATLDASNQDIYPGYATILAWWLSTPAGAVLTDVDASGNPLTGGFVGGFAGDDTVYDGEDISGVSVLFPAMTKKVITLNVSNCGLGPSAMPELSKLVRDASAVVTSVNCLKNPLGDDGLATLTAAVETSSVGSICGLVEGQTSVDWSGQNFSPFDCKIIAADFNFRRFSAVLTRVSVLSNPIGADGADALIEVFNRNTNLRTLLGIEEGVTELNLSKKKVDPGQAKILAAELIASRAVAVLTDVNMSGNPITGKIGWNGSKNAPVDGKDISGVSALFPVMTRVTKLNVSECGLGPTSMPELAKLVRDASAALNSLTLSGNPLTGATLNGGFIDQYINIDSDMSGFVALCAVLGKLTEVNLSDCHLGPTSTGELVKVFSDADAVLNSLTINNNAIGGPCAVRLIDGAKTGVAVKKGVFAAVDGRWGKVVMDPDFDEQVRLTWLDDGTNNHYTKVGKLNPVVGSRTDLFEDYNHIEQFGQAIAQISSLDISNCNFTPASIKIFTSSVSWAKPQLLCLRELVLDRLPVSGATPKHGDFRYGVETVDADLGMFRVLCEVLRACQALTSLSLKKCYLGPQALAVLAEVVFRDASAVINEVNVSQNPIGVEGGKALANAIPESSLQCVVIGDKSTRIPLHNSEINSLDVSAQELGPGEVTVVAAAISTYAAIAHVALSGNMITGSKNKGNIVKPDWEYDLDLSGLVALGKAVAISKTLTSIDLSKCGISVLGVTEVAKFISAGAVLAKVNVLSNPIDADGQVKLVPGGSDEMIGADALIEVFEQNTNLRTLLGIEEGVTELSLSEKNVDPGQAKILAAELKASRAATAVNEVNVSQNSIGVEGGKALANVIPECLSLRWIWR